MDFLRRTDILKQNNCPPRFVCSSPLSAFLLRQSSPVVAHLTGLFRRSPWSLGFGAHRPVMIRFPGARPFRPAWDTLAETAAFRCHGTSPDKVTDAVR